MLVYCQLFAKISMDDKETFKTVLIIQIELQNIH